MEQAREFFEEGLANLHLANFRDGSLIWILANLVEVCLRLGDYNNALSYLNEAKNTSQEIDSKLWEQTFAYIEAIYLIWVSHEYDLALQICRESYQSVKISNREDLLTSILWVLVEYLMSTRHFELGIMLIGNMQSEEFEFGKPMFPIYCDDVERNLAIARKYIAEPVIDSILVKGKSMSQEAVFQRA